jgi:hypothetical protein
MGITTLGRILTVIILEGEVSFHYCKLVFPLHKE